MSFSRFSGQFSTLYTSPVKHSRQIPNGIPIGFWAEDSSDTRYPRPTPNSAVKDQSELIAKLKNFMETDENYIQYKGSSTCRLCGKNNGSREHKFGGYVIPSGYIHYLEQHNVAVDPRFEKYFMSIDVNAVNSS